MMRSISVIAVLFGVIPGVVSPALARQPEPKSSKLVLLLDDYRVVEAEPGDNGDYVIRRGKIIETVPSKRILFAGDSHVMVQKFLLHRADTMKPATDAIVVGFNNSSFPYFANKIQPVLSNLCANCHAKPSHAGVFKLRQIRPGYADPESVQINARATSLTIDRQLPSRSSLLLKSMTAHGGQKVAAISDPTSELFSKLYFWSTWAASKDGTPMPSILPPWSPEIRTAAASSSTLQKTLPRTSPATRFPSPEPAPEPDPFDPRIFNEVMHRYRKPQ